MKGDQMKEVGWVMARGPWRLTWTDSSFANLSQIQKVETANFR